MVLIILFLELKTNLTHIFFTDSFESLLMDLFSRNIIGKFLMIITLKLNDHGYSMQICIGKWVITVKQKLQ